MARPLLLHDHPFGWPLRLLVEVALRRYDVFKACFLHIYCMKSGIYIIRNQVNGKIYLGSASRIRSRWSTHKHQLRKNKHHSVLLQRAWNKYGLDAFVFEVLENTNVENLTEREQYYLDTMTPYVPSIGYNICRVANTMLGFKHSEETKAKLRTMFVGAKNANYGKVGEFNPNYGRRNTADTIIKMQDAQKGDKNHMFGKTGKENPGSKKVHQKLKDGTLLKTWDSLSDIGRELNYPIGNISSCCNGKKKSSKGFIWEWA